MTITLRQFVDKYDGKRISGYSTSGGQCVDECRQFMAECFGWDRATIYKAVPPGDAETWFYRANETYFRRVKNTPEGIPPENAIIVWLHGRYGHVAVARTGCTVTKVYSFDQNWSDYRLCDLEAHRYAECIGWLIKR